MRIAFFSDVHGNLLALEAVLGDIHHQGDADQYWVVGDHASASYLIAFQQGEHLPPWPPVRQSAPRS